jgi:hypothetical protein
MASGALVNFILILISAGSSQSLFSAANQLQLLLLLPLFRLYMPKPIVGFYRELSWTLFSLDFLKIDIWPGIELVSNTFSKNQSDPYLNLIGIKDYSSIMNVMPLLFMISAFVIAHIFIGLLYLTVKDKPNLS